jgi:hypothetical protein
MDALKYVELWVIFLTKLSAIEHIEEIHHHEGLEEEGVMKHVVGWVLVFVIEWGLDQVVADSEHPWSSKEQDEHHNGLIECLRSHSSPHEWGQNLVILLDALSSKFFWVWGFGRKCDGSHNIHNNVDPEELNDREWGGSKESSSKDDKEEARDVNCKLELNEFPDIVEDVTSPSDCVNNRGEVIIQDDNVSMILCNCASIHSHCETNISLTECKSIVDTFTGESAHAS